MRKKTGIIILIGLLMVSVFLVLKSMYFRQDVPGQKGAVTEKGNKETADTKQSREAETRPAERIPVGKEYAGEESILEIAAEIMRTKDAETAEGISQIKT
jgi:uncharacterized protein YpmB